MSTTLTVTVLADGPVKITNLETLRYCGEPLPPAGEVYLCRCGRSANAPFCDGTHRSTGFDGGCESPPSAEIVVWEGQTIRTWFNPNVCMHVYYCKPLKALRAREAAGDAQAAEEIIRVVASCPSGALSYESITTPGAEATSAPAVVDIVQGGEIRIQGSFTLNEPRWERQRSDAATLCRCGESMNKPWCDGRHKARKDFR